MGFSYTKSNTLGQFTADVNVRRRTTIRLFQLDLSSITTRQEGTDTQRRDDFSLTYNRLFEGPWFVVGSGGTQTNDELGLNLRVQLSAGPGYNFIQSNHADLVSSAGLSVNRETSDNADPQYNLEAFLSVDYSLFRYDYPKTDITMELTAYPNLTTWGRIRTELDISATREIVPDFTIVSGVFLQFVRQRAARPTADENDYEPWWPASAGRSSPPAHSEQVAIRSTAAS
jgi:hypothetical protein